MYDIWGEQGAISGPTKTEQSLSDYLISGL